MNKEITGYRPITAQAKRLISKAYKAERAVASRIKRECGDDAIEAAREKMREADMVYGAHMFAHPEEWQPIYKVEAA